LNRAFALLAAVTLGASLCLGGVAAQEESAIAEDGASAEETPEPTAVAPNVPLGANLTPLAPPLIPAPGSGQAGSSSVSMAPGTQTTGRAREGANAVRAPEAEPAPEAVLACSDYPTWYDAQLALESTTDETVIASLDPDNDTIACEEVMYP
jgi:hypothetical protein